jgi:hypothetical protein
MIMTFFDGNGKFSVLLGDKFCALLCNYTTSPLIVTCLLGSNEKCRLTWCYSVQAGAKLLWQMDRLLHAESGSRISVACLGEIRN